jgi:hypothetical protein
MEDKLSTKLGGWLVTIGALGVTIITGIYAATPPAASVPLPADVPIAVALAATRTASLKLTLAGSVGIVADILLIAGCALLALRDREPAVKRLFWIGIALSTGLFIVVDGLAGQVIPTIAAMTEKDLTAFALARKSFDIAFVLGVATFGAASLAAFAITDWPQLLRFAVLGLGILAIASVALHLAGVTLPLLIGASVGLAGILGIIIGVREMRRPSLPRRREPERISARGQTRRLTAFRAEDRSYPASRHAISVMACRSRAKMRHWRERCHNDAQVHRYYGCIVVRIGIGVSSPRKICSPSGCQGPGVAPAKGAVASSG